MNRISSVNILKVAAMMVVVSMLVWACSGTKPDGPPPVNAKPVVEIVNIPPTNSHFTQSPTINWYGTDIDGFITFYEYAVIPFTAIPSSVDTTDVEALKAFAGSEIKYASQGDCNPACWSIIDALNADSPTRQRVELVAGANPADTVKQYFFVRAVDDDSARSEIRVRVYSRNNNPPTTVIKTAVDSTGYYDLADTSSTYRGIFLEWDGEDKIDFPSDVDKPTFEFFYELFGPYSAGELSFGDDWNFTDGFDFDTLAAASRLVTRSMDTTTGSVWTSATTARFYNLWRNQPDSDTTRIGYFVLKVTARDDAAVSAVSPTYKVFQAISPKFENDVLVYYPVNGRAVAQPGSIWNSNWKMLEWWPDDWYVEDDMVEYFYEVFEEAGYPIPAIIRGMSVPVSSQNIPSKLELAKYKLYVILEDGENSELIRAHFERLSYYMDLGGNVWLFGTLPFGPYHSDKGAGLTSFPLQSKDRADGVPFKYFNVLGQYRGGWQSSYIPRATWDSQSGDPLPQTNDDFVGATPLPGTGFPSLDVDLHKVERTYIHLFSPELYTTKPWMNTEFRGAPNANYFVRDVFSQPIYLYKSYFGESLPDSMRAYLSPLQGTVTGLRYNSGIYKTAVFGFSLWSLEREDAVAVIQKMVGWFLE